MDTPNSLMSDLARRLLAAEAASQSVTDSQIHAAVRVCDKLRISLTRFAGADGFASLLRRALALARADVPALETVQLQPDGLLEGLEALTVDAMNVGPEAAVAITANLLGLLVTFIGEPITLRLIREDWPDESMDGFNESNEAL